jgi:hypothetical protein
MSGLSEEAIALIMKKRIKMASTENMTSDKNEAKKNLKKLLMREKIIKERI